MIEIPLDELRTYTRCSLEWFWERRAGAARPLMPSALIPLALRDALSWRYGGYTPSLEQGVVEAWGDWCAQWGDRAMLDRLLEYARKREAALKDFVEGRVARRDGSRYAAPEMTLEYKNKMHTSGALQVAARLDEFALAHGMVLPKLDHKAWCGSHFGNAFADALAGAKRSERDLPDPSIVLGWDTPFGVELGPVYRVTGIAQLVLQAAPDAGQGAVTLEIHDYGEGGPEKSIEASRDLRVIAASLGRPAAAADPPTWQAVDRVVYRNFATGTTHAFREASPGPLLAVVSAAGRGMASGVVLPRALTGFDACRPCAFRPRCWERGGWDSLDFVDLAALNQSAQILETVKQVRGALGGDAQAARRTREALLVIERALASAAPDVLGMRERLMEAYHEVDRPAAPGEKPHD